MTVMAIKPPSATFLGTRFEMRLVRTPQRKIRDPRTGEQIDTTEPDRVEFRNGTYVATDPLIAEWLRNHRLFNDPIDGFREMPQVAPELTQEEQLAMLQFATDPDGLQSLMDEETANWNRPAVAALLQAAIERLGAPV
jgi:hypothetical protein